MSSLLINGLGHGRKMWMYLEKDQHIADEEKYRIMPALRSGTELVLTTCSVVHMKRVDRQTDTKLPKWSSTAALSLTLERCGGRGFFCSYSTIQQALQFSLS